MWAQGRTGRTSTGRSRAFWIAWPSGFEPRTPASLRRPSWPGVATEVPTAIAQVTVQRDSSSSPAAPSSGAAPLAYFWGDDAYGLESAVETFRKDGARFPDGLPDRWRPEERPESGRLLGAIRERLATGSMFGAGSVAIVPGLGALVRSGAGKEEFAAILATVAPGNGLAIVEE